MAGNRIYLEGLRMSNEQREHATREMLTKKRRLQRDVKVKLPTDDGPVETTLLYQAIGSQAYDKLVTKFPPTPKQKAEGGNFDIDRFAPELLARVCVDPDMTPEDWKTIWTSDDWNRGELLDLFFNAVDVCTRGLDPTPTESG